MDFIGYVLIGLIITVGVWIFVGSKKVRWYKVYLASKDVMLLGRNLRERWWRTSDRYMRFIKETGEEITFPSQAHWILFWEEVPNGMLDKAREEIRQWQMQKEKENA